MKKPHKKDSPEFVYRYLEQNPDATHSDYKRDFPNTKLTQQRFSGRKYTYRNKLKGRDRNSATSTGSLISPSAADEAIKKLKYEDSNAFINEYLKIDPDRTLANLKVDFPQSKMKSGTFYSRKHHFKNGTLIPSTARPYAKRKNNSLYMTIWERSLEDMDVKERKITRDVITDFVESVSNTGRVNWQIVELVNPSVLELREIAK